MTNIVNLSSLDEDDAGYMNFIEDLKTENGNAIFIIEKANGEVMVGSNFENRRDLVYAIYRLQGLAQTLVNGGDE